jgi:GTPase
MFVDRAIIQVRAGNGGDGCLSFHRGPFLPKGGPDGGDGGKGGDVILVADPGLNTLIDFKGVRLWRAKHGQQGRGKQQYGKSAPDLIIRVPAGTVVFDEETREILHDIGPGDSVIVAKGGKGGYGNEHYKSSTNQAPRKISKGQPGEEFLFRLELKLIADVGLVGLPNAGKSTLLSRLTSATPKIADYPFTTLSPNIGIAILDEVRRIIFADIPGLIEGASEGAGLGHNFLRHTERTRVIVHLIDPLPDKGTPAENYCLIRNELEAYSADLAEKPEIIVLNKTDLFIDDEDLDEVVRDFRSELRLGADIPLLTMSAATGKGVTPLLENLWTMLHRKDEALDRWPARNNA